MEKEKKRGLKEDERLYLKTSAKQNLMAHKLVSTTGQEEGPRLPLQGGGHSPMQ